MAPERSASPAVAPVNLHEYEPLARAKLSPMAYDYLAQGSGDELTLRWNRERWDAVRLHPRVLVDVGSIETGLDLLGCALEFPILLAPTGFQRLFHPEGELATVRGAHRAGALTCASTAATTTIEEVGAAARGPLWFQLYVQRDRGFTRELIQRAERAGARAIVLTVDTPVLGARDRDHRNQLALPPGLELANLKALASHASEPHTFSHRTDNPFLDPTLSWDTIEWVRECAGVPVVVKGVLSPEDARRAVARGAAAVIVSNHGGRNLDTVPATVDALPRVVDAIAETAPVLVDGGIRRGIDVFKALALGARAVLIGRPYLWALAVDGEAGVARAIELLRGELVMAMALCGTPRLADITRAALWA